MYFNLELPARKPVPQPLPRGTKTPTRPTETKTPARPQPSIGTKTPAKPSPGVKGRQTPARVTTTARPSITEADDSDDEEPLPAKPAPSPRPSKVTPATGTWKLLVNPT